MTYAIVLVSLALFVLAFRFARILPIASEAMTRARAAVAIITDPSKSEDEKERAARQAAIVLFGRFFRITALAILALLPSALCLVAAVFLGVTDQAALMQVLLSPLLIAAAIALFVLDYAIRR